MKSKENNEIMMTDQYEHTYDDLYIDAISGNNSNDIQATQSSMMSRSCWFKTTFVIVCVLLAIAAGMAIRYGIAFHDLYNETEKKNTEKDNITFPRLQDDNVKKDLRTGQGNAPSLCCETDWTKMLNHCYYFGEKKLTWEESEAECMRMNSHLVKIESKTENDMIVAKVKTSELRFTDVYIGLRRNVPGRNSTEFVWTDGSSVTFNDWDEGEPSLSYRGVQEKCVELRKIYGYRWNDVSCSERGTFICEKSPSVS